MLLLAAASQTIRSNCCCSADEDGDECGTTPRNKLLPRIGWADPGGGGGMGRTPLLLASLLAESERALSASRMVADAILHPGKCPGVRVLCPESGSTPDGQLDQSQAASNVVLVSVEPAGNRTRTASPPLITCTDGPGPSSSSSESTTNGRAEEKGRMRTIGCGHLDTYWWACLRTAMGVVAVVHVCCGEHADENAAPPPRRQQRNTGSIRVTVESRD